MEIITQRYKRETGKSAYKHNWLGKRIHNQDYIDWLEKQCTISGVVGQSEQLKCHHQYMNAGTLQGEAMKKCLICGEYVKAL